MTGVSQKQNHNGMIQIQSEEHQSLLQDNQATMSEEARKCCSLATLAKGVGLTVLAGVVYRGGYLIDEGVEMCISAISSTNSTLGESVDYRDCYLAIVPIVLGGGLALSSLGLSYQILRNRRFRIYDFWSAQ